MNTEDGLQDGRKTACRTSCRTAWVSMEVPGYPGGPGVPRVPGNPWGFLGSLGPLRSLGPRSETVNWLEIVTKKVVDELSTLNCQHFNLFSENNNYPSKAA